EMRRGRGRPVVPTGGPLVPARKMQKCPPVPPGTGPEGKGEGGERSPRARHVTKGRPTTALALRGGQRPAAGVGSRLCLLHPLAPAEDGRGGRPGCRRGARRQGVRDRGPRDPG